MSGDEKKEELEAPKKPSCCGPWDRVPPFEVSVWPAWYYFINPLCIIAFILDFVFFIITFKFVHAIRYALRGPMSKESNSREKIRRHPDFAGQTQLLDSYDPEKVKTVYQMFMSSCEKYKGRKCFGTRTYLGNKKGPGDPFPRKVFGETKWKTYEQAKERVESFGKGLIQACEMQPLSPAESEAVTEQFSPLAGPHCLMIYEDTSEPWITAAMGAMTQSLVVATSYATLGVKAVCVALEDTQAPVIVCNYDKALELATHPEVPTSLRYIVYTRVNIAAEEPKHPKSVEGSNVKILDMEEVMEIGKNAVMEAVEPSPNNLALIMYTSGSTGKPKGVMLKHSSIVAAASGVQYYFKKELKMSPETPQQYVGYLPAAHILEFCAEMSMISMGAQIGFSDTKSFVSKGAYRSKDGTMEGELNGEPVTKGDPTTQMPPGGWQEFGPTALAAVPKIWDSLKSTALGKVALAAPSGLKYWILRPLLQYLFSVQTFYIQMGCKSTIASVVFGKLFGSMISARLQVMLTGGGPISAFNQNFVRVFLNNNLVQGYALTETCSAGCIQPAWSFHNSYVGGPLACVEMKLNSCKEFQDREGKDYLNTDTVHRGKPCLGRGEIWIKGPAVSSGYYAEKDKTEAEFDKQGWFHTGDIGIWTSNGSIQIVDRLKNLVKLIGGEYIAIESMESTFAQSKFVNAINGGILVYGDGDMDKPVALIQVNTSELITWASQQGIEYGSVEELCSMEVAANAVRDELNAKGKMANLGGNEKLIAVKLLPGTAEDDAETGPTARWTPANQYLTASNKLNRKPILAGFEKEIDELKKQAVPGGGKTQITTSSKKAGV